jgi:hypothetical protein
MEERHPRGEAWAKSATAFRLLSSRCFQELTRDKSAVALKMAANVFFALIPIVVFGRGLEFNLKHTSRDTAPQHLNAHIGSCTHTQAAKELMRGGFMLIYQWAERDDAGSIVLMSGGSVRF